MSYYSQETLGPYELFDLGDFELDCGRILPGAQLAYETHGALNERRDNAILFPVMFSGASKHMEHLIGRGMALDPEKYFIVVPNQLGNGLSSSPHNTAAPLDGPRFPKLSIYDDVRAQKKLLSERFDVQELQLVLGWSMGAQQTYAWAMNHPEMVKRAAPIAGTARTTPHDALFVEVFCEALRSDPAWQQGDYAKASDVSTGLKRLAHIFALMGLSSEFYRQRLWERLGFDSREAFLTGFWKAWFAPMDPNNLLCMADKWLRGEMGPVTSDISKALTQIQAKTFVMTFEEDMFIKPEDCAAEQELIPGSELKRIPTLCGHFGMLPLFAEDKERINSLLAQLIAMKV
jgi:homoserine O-acetyltransferase/O-succinyltransferase